MMGEIERIPSLDAQELAVYAGTVAVIAADNLVVPHPEGRLAAIGTMCANRAHVLHFPRPRLIPVRAAGQRPDRANIDTLAAFVAVEMVAFIRRNQRNRAAIDYAQRPHTHAFIARPHAA